MKSLGAIIFTAFWTILTVSFVIGILTSDGDFSGKWLLITIVVVVIDIVLIRNVFGYDDE